MMHCSTLQFDFGLNDWCSLKVTWLQENWNWCSHSVVKLHVATQMFVMVGRCKGDDCEEVL